MSQRVRVPESLRREVMYESAYRCAVCQSGGKHIHHIDKDSSNNEKDNLVLLCVDHHDEAHTTRENSLNLTAARLKHARMRWTSKVRERREAFATVQGQPDSAARSVVPVGAVWAYINHRRVSQQLSTEILGAITPSIRARLQARSILDENGFLKKPASYKPNSTHLHNTIYDWYEHSESLLLHRFYTEAVDAISRRSATVVLEQESWTKAFFGQFVKPGVLVFYQKAHYFKEVSCDRENAHIEARTFKRNVEIQFGMDTRDMFGTTAISTSFRGHASCSALLVVKSVSLSSEGRLIASASPMALGVGFSACVTE